MAGKLVKHKLHEDWGIGEVDNDSEIINGKIIVDFPDIQTDTSVFLCRPENLEIIGFYD